MKFWLNILNQLKESLPIILMYVVESQGSSPGRQGFRMMVQTNGEIHGSIGGGIMEHKMVELARSLLKKGRFDPFLKIQIHQADIPDNRSGMICSGEQKIAFYWLDHSQHLLIKAIATTLHRKKDVVLELTPQSFTLARGIRLAHQFEFQYSNAQQWQYRENLGFKNKIFIIGAGHVGLALSQTMNHLGFHVEILDDRHQLNTLKDNPYVHKKHLIDYERIGRFIPSGENIFIVLVSFGYQTDALCIRKLLDKKVKYFGIMGSKAKMAQLLADLRQEGYPAEKLAKLYTPIGLPIQSKTPAEIAISIAAEIIKVKNYVERV